MTVTKYNVGDKLYTKSNFNLAGYNEYIITDKTETSYKYALIQEGQLADCGWVTHFDLDDNAYIYECPEDIPQNYAVKQKPKKNARCIN